MTWLNFNEKLVFCMDIFLTPSPIVKLSITEANVTKYLTPYPLRPWRYMTIKLFFGFVNLWIIPFPC